MINDRSMTGWCFQTFLVFPILLTNGWLVDLVDSIFHRCSSTTNQMMPQAYWCLKLIVPYIVHLAMVPGCPCVTTQSWGRHRVGRGVQSHDVVQARVVPGAVSWSTDWAPQSVFCSGSALWTLALRMLSVRKRCDSAPWTRCLGGIAFHIIPGITVWSPDLTHQLFWCMFLWRTFHLTERPVSKGPQIYDCCHVSPPRWLKCEVEQGGWQSMRGCWRSTHHWKLQWENYQSMFLDIEQWFHFPLQLIMPSQAAFAAQLLCGFFYLLWNFVGIVLLQLTGPCT